MTEAIIFLDIDGVLASPRSFALPGNRVSFPAGTHAVAAAAYTMRLDPCASALANRLAGKSGTRIVVSSF